MLPIRKRRFSNDLIFTLDMIPAVIAISIYSPWGYLPIKWEMSNPPASVMLSNFRHPFSVDTRTRGSTTI
jgi:hypothetical protein